MAPQTPDFSILSDAEDYSVWLRSLLAKNPPRNTRQLFLELNPHLAGNKIFQNRYEARREAAVLVPIILRDEPTVLLTVRSKDMPSHAG